MTRMKIGFSMAVLLLAFGVVTHAQEDANTPEPGLAYGELAPPEFAAVFQDSDFGNTLASSFQCWEMGDTCGCSDQCSGTCGKTQRWGAVTEQDWREVDSLVATLPKRPGPLRPMRDTTTLGEFERQNYERYSSIENQASNDRYYRQIAVLLSVTINSKDVDEKSKLYAIETALKLVAKNAKVQDEWKRQTLEQQHEKTLVMYQEQIRRLAAERDSLQQANQWIKPIYKNQAQHYKRMDEILRSNASLGIAVRRLEQRVSEFELQSSPKTANRRSLEPLPALRRNELSRYDDHFGYSNSTASGQSDTRSWSPRNEMRAPASFPLRPLKNASYESQMYDRPGTNDGEFASVDEQAEAKEIAYLRRRIAELDRQLERLTQPVRQADHLEPVYTPEQPLEPLFQRYRK